LRRLSKTGLYEIDQGQGRKKRRPILLNPENNRKDDYDPSKKTIVQNNLDRGETKNTKKRIQSGYGGG